MRTERCWLLVFTLGCSSEPATPAGAAGAAGSASGGVAGASSQAGAAGTPSISGSGGGGTATGGGGTGPSASAGAGGVAAGAAGQAGTGGASAGTGGGGGASSGVAPSAGCGKSGRPNGGEVMVPNDRIYDFPTTYDGNEPFPLVIALHGANNSNTILQTLSKGSRLESEFVRAFPKSNGSAWSFQNGTGADSQRISSIYEEALANYCIDKNRVFLTGHSSGAQMAVQMMCVAGGDKRFKAVAPVAASKYCDTLTPVPVMYIQGTMDAQRNNSDGANVVAVFRASNTCMDTTAPDPDVPTCKSTFDQQTVDPGCKVYQGCSKPTIWCSHNDNGYNNTDGHMHGWPCFASNAIADFFSKLP